jgi:hypothetical protein
MQLQASYHQQILNNTTNNNNNSHQPVANQLNNPYYMQNMSHNYSFDDAPTDNRILMQPHHSHQYNPNDLQMLSAQNSFQQGAGDMLDFNPNFQRNNPKRNTLKRSQRVIEPSVEDLPNALQAHSNGKSIPNGGAKIQGSVPPSNRDREFTKPPQAPRRKSLPSIIKNQAFKEDETAHSSSELHANKNPDLFIIENGIRKRITEKSNSSMEQANLILTGNKHAHALGMLEDQSPKLPRKIVLESITSLNSPSAKSNAKRVSMPSIPAALTAKYANKGKSFKRRLFYFRFFFF